uniref:Uncharacterized protein n=1 Tax=Romanomermis culicivorax TaxID=13658 RepID=A0A915IBF8_ROMCU
MVGVHHRSPLIENPIVFPEEKA